MADHDDGEIAQLASSHQRYLSAMIAEQEAALSRFQNSNYVGGDPNQTQQFAGSARRTGGAAVNDTSMQLSASGSPYTFSRGGPTNARAYSAAAGPGYRGPRAVSPTGSASSAASSDKNVNTTALQTARRTIAEAQQWNDGTDVAAAAYNRSRGTSASSGLSPSRNNAATLNDTALSTAALTSEVEAKMWNQDKMAWERRMAELEDRLKRVNNAAVQSQGGSNAATGQQQLSTQTQQSSSSLQSTSQYNVAVVNGRGVNAGTDGARALAQTNSTHNVHTSSLVLRLEQELATAVEALVRERQQTAQREQEVNERITSLEEEIAAGEKKTAQLNTKWMNEFERQTSDFQEQLTAARKREAQLQGEAEERERELAMKKAEVSKLSAKVAQCEIELRDATGALEESRSADEKKKGRINELEHRLANMDSEKRTVLSDMEGRSRQHTVKIERMKEEWLERMDRQKEELKLAHDKDLRAMRGEMTELERKWRECEHDAFVLSGEVNKMKEQLVTKEMEVEKQRQLAIMDVQGVETKLKSERDTHDVQLKTLNAKMQSALDESHAVLMETTSKLESEARRARDLQSKLDQHEIETRGRVAAVAEKDATIQSREGKITSLQGSLAELEKTTESQASQISQLRHSNANLTEEITILQKKLDARLAGKAEELKAMEAEHKKYREKTRSRLEEQEKLLEEARSKVSTYTQRNDAMKNDFDLALSQATAEQADVIHRLERKVEKLQAKLANKSDHSSMSLQEKERLISSLRQENENRMHAEAQALQQLQELEGRYKKERSKLIEVEAKLNHILAVAPDGVAHQRVLAELVAAKQVATNIQGRYREIQAKYERQSVRQNALQQLLTRLQEEQQHNMYRVPAKTYLAQPGLPLYRPLGSAAAGGASSAALDDSLDFDSRGGRTNGKFTMEEEDMYRTLMRDQDRKRRVRQHVRDYAQASSDDSDGGSDSYAAGRSTYSSRTRRSHSVPKDRPRSRERHESSCWGAELNRTRDDADVNLHLKIDTRTLKRIKELEVFPTCVHIGGAKPHDSRSCKVCQRRAFGRGLDLNQHYAESQHIPSRNSPVKSSAIYGKMPHT